MFSSNGSDGLREDINKRWEDMRMFKGIQAGSKIESFNNYMGQDKWKQKFQKKHHQTKKISV